MDEYDETTEQYLLRHFGIETTVCRCEKCGKLYKPSLGHVCEENRRINSEEDSYSRGGYKHPS